MESLTQPQFIAFLVTIGVPIVALVVNQIGTNKKMIDMVEAQNKKLADMALSQEKAQELHRETLASIEKHIQKSVTEHAVLLERTSTKDQ